MKQISPSIGILICKERNKVVAEYALREINKPIGISEYQLTEKVPAELKGQLPTTKQIQNELKGIKSPGQNECRLVLYYAFASSLMSGISRIGFGELDVTALISFSSVLSLHCNICKPLSVNILRT